MESVVTYTATFASLAEDPAPATEPEETPPVKTEEPAPEKTSQGEADQAGAEKEPAEEPSAEEEKAPEENAARGGLKRILIFGGIAAALAAGGVFVSKKIRRRR